MNFDTKQIYVLYESIFYKNLDYLLVEEDENFDWDSFFERYEFDKCNIFESFKNLGDVDLTKNGSFKRKYEIDINDKKFYIHLSIHVLSDLENSYSSDLVGIDKDSSESRPALDILNIIKTYPDSYMLNIYFEDSDSNIKLSGSVGNYSLSVLRNVERCTMDFLSSNGLVNKTQIISFQVDKNESKRIKLYNQFMIRTGYISMFPNKIIDTKTSKSYDKLYYTK
jgi:hypothetical protein